MSNTGDTCGSGDVFSLDDAIHTIAVIYPEFDKLSDVTPPWEWSTLKQFYQGLLNAIKISRNLIIDEELSTCIVGLYVETLRSMETVNNEAFQLFVNVLNEIQLTQNLVYHIFLFFCLSDNVSHQVESLFGYLSMRISIHELSSIILQLQSDSDVREQVHFKEWCDLLNQLLRDRNATYLEQLPSLLTNYTSQLAQLTEAIGFNVSIQLYDVLISLNSELKDCTELKHDRISQKLTKILVKLSNSQNEKVQTAAIDVLSQMCTLCPSLISNRTVFANKIVSYALNKSSIDLAIAIYTFLDTLCNRAALLADSGDASVLSSLIGVVKTKLQPSDVALRAMHQQMECVCALQWVHHNRTLLPLVQQKLRLDLVEACLQLFTNSNRDVWVMLAEVIQATRVPMKDIRSSLSKLKSDLLNKAVEQLKPYFPDYDFSDLILSATSPKLKVQTPSLSHSLASPRFSVTPKKTSNVFTFDAQVPNSPAASPRFSKIMNPCDYGRYRLKSDDNRFGSFLSQKNVREKSVELSYIYLSSPVTFSKYVSFLHSSKLLDEILLHADKEMPKDLYSQLDMNIRQGKGFSDGDLRLEIDCVVRFIVMRLLGRRIVNEIDSVMSLVISLCDNRLITLTEIEMRMLLLGLFYVNSFSNVNDVLLKVNSSCSHDMFLNIMLSLLTTYSLAISFSNYDEYVLLGILNAIEAFVTESVFCHQSKSQFVQCLLNLQEAPLPSVQQAAQRVCERYCDEGSALIDKGFSTSTDLRVQLCNAYNHRAQRKGRMERAKSTESLRSKTGSSGDISLRSKQYPSSKGKGSSSKGSSSYSSRSKDLSSSSKSKGHSSSSKHSQEHPVSYYVPSTVIISPDEPSIISDDPVDDLTSYITSPPPAVHLQPHFIPTNRHTLVSSYVPKKVGNDADENDESQGDAANADEPSISPHDDTDSDASEFQSPNEHHDMSNSDSFDDEMIPNRSSFSETEEESQERRNINEIASVFHVFNQLYQSCSYICIIQKQYSNLYGQLLKAVEDINQFLNDRVVDMSSEERSDLLLGLFVLFRHVVAQYAVINTRINDEINAIEECKEAIKQNREEYDKSGHEYWIAVAKENQNIMFDHRVTLEVLQREVKVLPAFVGTLLNPFKIISNKKSSRHEICSDMSLLAIHHMTSTFCYCYDYSQYLSFILEVLDPVLHDMCFYSPVETVYTCLLDFLVNNGLEQQCKQYKEKTMDYVINLLKELHEHNMKADPPYGRTDCLKMCEKISETLTYPLVNTLKDCLVQICQDFYQLSQGNKQNLVYYTTPSTDRCTVFLKNSQRS